MLFRRFIKFVCHRMFILTSTKSFRIFIAIAMAILSTVVLMCYIGMLKPGFIYYSLLINYESTKINNSTKTILLWTAFFDSPKWYLPSDTVNQSFFEERQCPHTNCLITTNRTHLSSISYFDAVIFHSARKFPNNAIPLNRSAKQLYVFGSKESPINTWHNLKPEHDFYNLTMTYRLDSDIVWTYGSIRDIETKEMVAPALKPYWKSPPDSFIPDEALSKKIKGRSKKAAWIVSHCKAESKRDDLGKGIQKRFALDIYGRCGNLLCSRNKSSECYAKITEDYKFYLSFENTLCEDYVTEKFYRALQDNIIPIVYGGADYNRFAPPNSYINVEDFPTISALTDYLKYVDSNLTEYNKYFWWKQYYEVSHKIHFCQLCTILNKPSSREKTQIYKNIEKWWIGNYCRKPKIIFD